MTEMVYACEVDVGALMATLMRWTGGGDAMWR